MIFGFSLTHDNFNEDNTEKEDVAVGGSVNIYCNQGNKRIVEDKWDEGKGPTINYVGNILPIFDPLPPPYVDKFVYYISLCCSIGIWLTLPSPRLPT